MINFPNTPALNQTFVGPTGAVWQWDGVKWVALVSSAGFAAVQAPNVGRNYIHNPLFNIAQRGLGPWSTSIYSADRWQIQQVTDTVSYNIVGILDSQRTAIGDEEATWGLNNNFTGSAAAGAYNYLQQPIENVRRLAGKTVTVSFWAQAATGSPKIGINLLQFFGTGGSPSTAVRALASSNPVTISSVAMARYSTTITLPSILGKTLGSNGDSRTCLELWFSAGANNNVLSGNLGVQTASITLWGVQVEVGTSATPLEKPDPRYDLANCQRFYQVGGILWTGYGATIGQQIYSQANFPVTMRAVPTLVVASTAGTANITAPTITVVATQTTGAVAGQGTFTAAGAALLNMQYTASADL